MSICLFFQALGALIGSGAAVWGELAYMRAMRDGRLDRAERAHLDSIAGGLRAGMLMLLLSSLGITVGSYLNQSVTQPALTSTFWVVTLLSLLIVYTTWALSRARVSFIHGSTLVFSAWWFLTYLTFGWLPWLTFGAAIALFVVLTVIFFGLLRLIRSLAQGK